MPLPELPRNFSIHTRTSLRSIIGLGALLYITGLAAVAMYEANWITQEWSRNEPWWGRPVKRDNEGNPIVRLAKITPLDNDTSIPFRQEPSGSSVLLKSLSPMEDIFVIEVYGSQYRSSDARGRHYKQDILGGELWYGRWFKLTIDDITGYVSGNFVTILHENELPQKENVNNGGT